MIEDELKEIEARAASATPGPWRVEEDTTLVWGTCALDDQTSYGMGNPVARIETKRFGRFDETESINNSVFISAARTDIPTLITEIRRLQQLLANPWRPISEYKPEYGKVLVVDNNSYHEPYSEVAEIGADGRWWHADGEYEIEPDAFMPIPSFGQKE